MSRVKGAAAAASATAAAAAVSHSSADAAAATTGNLASSLHAAVSSGVESTEPITALEAATNCNVCYVSHTAQSSSLQRVERENADEPGCEAVKQSMELPIYLAAAVGSTVALLCCLCAVVSALSPVFPRFVSRTAAAVHPLAFRIPSKSQ